jgi:hypothetical protein
MRLPILAISFLMVLYSHDAFSQAINNSNFFTGVQLINVSTGEKARQPMIQIHGTESLSIGDKIMFSADVNLLKNTIPFSIYNGKVLEFIQLNAPVHCDYQVLGSFFLEGGIYIGAIVRSSNVYVSEFIQVKNFETLQAFGDAGFITGLSLQLKKLGKISLRYNHGLLASVPVDEDKIVKHRMIALGFTAIF